MFALKYVYLFIYNGVTSMHKLLLFAIAISCVTFTLLAQQPVGITLTQSNHTIVAGNYMNYFFNGFPLTLQLGQSQTWELNKTFMVTSGVNQAFNTYVESTNSQYPGALSQPDIFEVLAAQRGYNYDAYYKQSADGFAEIANVVSIDNAWSISDLTGGSADTLYMPKQTILMSAPRTVVHYPASYGTTWQSAYRRVTNAKITVAAFGLNQATISKASNFVITDSVVADGSMRVPMDNGLKSKPYNVLLVKRKTIRQDSIYLNGMPAPELMLAAFGLTQGTRDTTYKIIAWRAESVNYMAFFNYNHDNTYTNYDAAYINGSGVEPDIQSSVLGEVVPNATATPNPTNDVVNIGLQKTNDAPLHVELYTALGQKVHSIMFSVPCGDITIPVFVHTLPNGAYRAIIRGEDNNILRTASFVVAK